MRASRIAREPRKIDKFYAGLIHEISGPRNCGKSWLCYHEIISYLNDNPGKAVIVDVKLVMFLASYKGLIYI